MGASKENPLFNWSLIPDDDACRPVRGFLQWLLCRYPQSITALDAVRALMIFVNSSQLYSPPEHDDPRERWPGGGRGAERDVVLWRALCPGRPLGRR